jgi:glutathione synthase/RimK-type ligase-like ATP-grasp enzyme
MANVLITLAEDREATTATHFAVKHRVDENDCYDFASGLTALGHDVFFVNWDDLEGARFRRMFHDNKKRFVEPIPLSHMDLIFVYKMEGFYFDLPRFHRMVRTFESSGACVVNDPATIRHNINKRYYWDLAARGLRLAPAYRIDGALRQRIGNGERFVLKPLLGERGHGVILVRSPGDLLKIRGKESIYLAQRYLHAIRNGERSLVFLGLDFQHAVIKRPPANNTEEFRCNESLGGTVAVYEPREDELSYAVEVLKTYQALGYPVHFSRIDIVDAEEGPTLIEAELLNPSIYANYANKGARFGTAIASYFDRLMRETNKAKPISALRSGQASASALAG